ncbi:MAG: hypothetical protein CMO01_07050 [Thalassobius sp.]|nr:hypothetical protein [Thalassovita sp.]
MVKGLTSLSTLKLTTFRKVFFLMIALLVSGKILAQDPQFTQFYAAPLYLNPAFTGSTGEGRIIANYRNQWPGLSANFVTYAASYDQYFPGIKSGVGIMLKRDEQGGGASSPFVSNDVNLFYSYLIPLNEVFAISAGLQLGYGLRDLNFNNFLFGDQIDDNGPTGNATGETFSGDQIGYFDVSSGLVLFSNNLWVGFAAHHLNTPNLSFLGDTDPLQMKFNVHAGYKIMIGQVKRRNRKVSEQSITPVIHYKSQGKADQFSIGAYANYDPIVFGLWYRGLPVKEFENAGLNQDAFAVLVGFNLDNLSIGYSYDYTISGLSNVNTYGSHEVSLTYHIKYKDKGRRKGFGYPQVVCPNPWKKYQKLKYEHTKPFNNR